MIETATSETFRPHVGDTFRIAPPSDPPFEARLTSCTETPFGDRKAWLSQHQRVPFSLIFHAPDDRHVDQQIGAFSHAQLGEFELFIVPLGPDEDGMRYEDVIG